MRILTWIKPTWDWMHLWNYLGMMRPLIDISKKWKTYLMIADLHSLTSVHSWEKLRSNTDRMLKEIFSLIPDDIVVFKQSDIKRLNDISWILSSVTPYSLMLRAHSFKDSQNKNSNINMATFNYPILMTADIISYDIDIVPVWKDQKQHLEFARDIAEDFNKRYNTDVFKLPEPEIKKSVWTIPWTDGRKMSKSYNNFIWIFDDEKTLKKKIMSIETDDTPLENPKDPDNCNVFNLIEFFADNKKTEDIRKKYLAWNYWYGHAKLELLDIILEYFSSARQKYLSYENNMWEINDRLEKWALELNEIADKKYEKISKLIWIK